MKGYELDLTPELNFQTGRSGGKGGQNVNKVETMVEAYFDVRGSKILGDEEKTLVLSKLKNRINSEGVLQVRSQVHRSQGANKNEAIRKMHELVSSALKKEKKRIATKPSPFVKEKRLSEKKKRSEHKQSRQKYRHLD
jgi:ribosome-associated protein